MSERKQYHSAESWLPGDECNKSELPPESSLAASGGSDAGVESETCSDCDRGYVPAWDGEGNEIGEQPCQRCGGTGSIDKSKPQPNEKGQRPALGGKEECSR